jgi:hypothetical protein
MGSMGPATVLDHPRTLPQRDHGFRPPLHRSPVGIHRDIEVSELGQQIDNVLAVVIP